MMPIMYKLLYIFFPFCKDCDTFMLYFWILYLHYLYLNQCLYYILATLNRFFFHLLPALLSLAQMINNLFQWSVVIPARQKGCDVISLGVALVNTRVNMWNILAAHQKAEQRGAE